MPGGNDNLAHGRFFLPGDGGAAVAEDKSRFINFLLMAPKEAGVAHCRIGYYFRNILVQSQQLTANIGQEGGFRIATDFTITRDLTSFENIPERPRISVLTNSNGSGVHQIVIRSVDPQSEKADGETLAVNEATLGETMGRLRAALNERSPATKERRREDLAQDLRVLAPLGWTLYTQLPGQRPYLFGPLADSPETYVVQVLRPTTSGFVVPWALMYEIPLLSDRPTVCPLISKWDETEPLVTESMRTCPHGPHLQDVLCPFGFWGFRYAIEQLASSDSPALEVRASATCDMVMAQTQFGVDLKALAGHMAAMSTLLRLWLPNAQAREGKDKATIRTLLDHDLPLVYFYCHGERRNVADPNVWLSVGQREILTAQEFIGWLVAWRQQRKLVWNDVRPLVFVNACHSVSIYPTTLVSYVDAFVGSARAAGVIGTEVKVQQDLAASVAEKFFDLLLSGGKTVEAALRKIRFEYLAVGNLVGLLYTPYCWADLRIVRA
jgi:CHAT domain